MLGGGTPHANFSHLAHGWGLPKGFHSEIANSVFGRRGDVAPKRDTNSKQQQAKQQRQQQEVKTPPQQVLAEEPPPDPPSRLNSKDSAQSQSGELNPNTIERIREGVPELSGNYV